MKLITVWCVEVRGGQKWYFKTEKEAFSKQSELKKTLKKHPNVWISNPYRKDAIQLTKDEFRLLDKVIKVEIETKNERRKV